MTPLSPHGLKVLSAIHDFISQKSYAPTLGEISEIIGLKSVSTVHKHVSRLRAGGFLEPSSNYERDFRLTATGKYALMRTAPKKTCPHCGKEL